MKKCLIFCLLLLLPTAYLTADSGFVEIRLDKKVYLVGEPLWMDLVFRPEPFELRQIEGRERAWHNWNVVYRRQESTQAYGMAVWSDVEVGGEDVIGPLPDAGIKIGKSFSWDGKVLYPEMSESDAGEAELQVVFNQPGYYVFQANYQINEPPPDSKSFASVAAEYSSNSVLVEVIEPEGEENEVWERLSEHFENVYYASGMLVSDPVLEARARDTLIQLVSDHPQSVYVKRFSKFLKENDEHRYREISTASSESAPPLMRETSSGVDSGPLKKQNEPQDNAVGEGRRIMGWLYFSAAIAIACAFAYWRRGRRSR